MVVLRRLRGAAALALALAGGLACSESHEADDGGPSDGGAVADTGASLDAWMPRDAGPPLLCHPAGDCGVRDVVAGMAHTCVLLSNGTVGCWGSNEYLQLGREGLDGSVRPLELSMPSELTRLMRGYTYSCGADAAGTIWCWGDGTEPLLERSAEPSSDWIPGVADVVHVVSGGSHTCALQSTGHVYCWGFRAGDGQLGIGTREVHREPVQVAGLEDVVEIAVGNAHNCARTAAGKLFCWGDNGDGQIGDGTGGEPEPTADALSPVHVLDGVRRVVAGGTFTCALRSEGEVLCWGRGAIGSGTFERVSPSPEAVALPAGTAVADIFAPGASGMRACALLETGRVMCWGRGWLGYGGGDARLPVEVGGIDDATAVALGYAHSCVIRRGGDLWCWGKNDDGQVGDGTTETRELPVPVVGLR